MIRHDNSPTAAPPHHRTGSAGRAASTRWCSSADTRATTTGGAPTRVWPRGTTPTACRTSSGWRPAPSASPRSCAATTAAAPGAGAGNRPVAARAVPGRAPGRAPSVDRHQRLRARGFRHLGTDHLARAAGVGGALRSASRDAAAEPDGADPRPRDEGPVRRLPGDRGPLRGPNRPPGGCHGRAGRPGRRFPPSTAARDVGQRRSG